MGMMGKAPLIKIIARRYDARGLPAVREQCVRHITALGLRITDEGRNDGDYSVWSLNLNQLPDNLQATQQWMYELSGQTGMDVLLLSPPPALLHSCRLVVFDMDSTLITTEVIDELANALGVGEAVAELTACAVRGELHFTESLQKRVRLLKGVSEKTFAEVAQRLQLSEGVTRLLRTLSANGIRTALLTSGFRYFAVQLAQKLSIDDVYANELKMKNGFATGELTGDIIDGAGKKERLLALVRQHNMDIAQTIAVGDGANDIPMLQAAGMGVGFRTQPIVRAANFPVISQVGLDSLLCLMQ